MTEFDVVETLKNAYDATTRNNNLFLKAIEAICWQCKYYADGEYTFHYGDIIFACQNFDPFTEKWKPSVFYRKERTFHWF